MPISTKPSNVAPVNTDEIVRALRSHAAMDNITGKAQIVCHRAADLIESLQAQLAESQRMERAAVDSLKRKCLDELAAVKCICDIETYLDLGSPKYIAKTIKEWRGPQADEERKHHERPNHRSAGANRSPTRRSI